MVWRKGRGEFPSAPLSWNQSPDSKNLFWGTTPDLIFSSTQNPLFALQMSQEPSALHAEENQSYFPPNKS